MRIVDSSTDLPAELPLGPDAVVAAIWASRQEETGDVLAIPSSALIDEHIDAERGNLQLARNIASWLSQI
jgi:hypothetical protein